ncbi:hypothetical protein NliqN6_0173 [Naganishia liquefaciens]|uniref:Cytochrome P450 n=1 Tax=Naganishia liquefaciens TaxID=104408 RepID=A0A8H3YDG6_9TREE|nr:hypothetical protein NliqN6_0173 [Naganishia liquefaciens]
MNQVKAMQFSDFASCWLDRAWTPWLLNLALPLVVVSLCFLFARPFRLQIGKPRPPPHVSSWVPWLGSGIHLASDPDSFFDRVTRKHGPVFSITAVGKKMIYVTSPDLIASVYSNPKVFDFPLIRRHLQMHIFGQSKEADHDMDEELFPAHSRHLQPGAIGDLVHSFARQLDRNISRFSEEIGQDGEIITETSRLVQAMSVSTLIAMMGTTFPADEFLLAFAKFDAEFTKLAGELPAWMCKDAIKYRDVCLDILERWYIEWSNRTEASELRAEEKVSSVIQAVLDFASKHGTKSRDVAAFLLADMFATQANAPPAAAWLIIKLAENPDSLERLRGEIQAGLAQCQDGTIASLIKSREIMNGETFAFLTSAIKETLRCATSVASIRRVTEDTVFGENRKGEGEGNGGVLLKRGEMIYCLTRPTHTDSSLHPDADHWIPERFIPEYKSQQSEGKTVRNAWMPFGGGTSMCEGRHFALQEIRIFMVTFFHHFDVRPTTTRTAQMDFSRGSGSGVMPAKKGWGLCVTRRADTGEVKP